MGRGNSKGNEVKSKTEHPLDMPTLRFELALNLQSSSQVMAVGTVPVFDVFYIRTSVAYTMYLSSKQEQN